MGNYNVLALKKKMIIRCKYSLLAYPLSFASEKCYILCWCKVKITQYSEEMSVCF